MLDGLGQLAFFDYMAGWKTAHSSYLSICLALAYFSCFFCTFVWRPWFLNAICWKLLSIAAMMPWRLWLCCIYMDLRTCLRCYCLNCSLLHWKAAQWDARKNYSKKSTYVLCKNLYTRPLKTWS